MYSKKMIFNQQQVFIKLSILFACLTLTVCLKAQTNNENIIFPTCTITPFELPEDESINFPLYQATSVGDINGDGFTDLLYKDYVGDERTPSMIDKIRKSVIITQPGINPEGIVFYDADFYGIGDYNGDGFDDVLDIRQKKIRFGSTEGCSNDSLMLSYPDNFFNFITACDVNNDGYSEIFIWGAINYSVEAICFSGPDTASIPWYYNEGSYHIDDYDSDGETELCYADPNNYQDVYQFEWYRLDKDNGEFILEHTETFDWIHEPSVHYPVSFCDINGDQLIDLAYASFVGDTVSRFNLDVFFGLQEPPYFENPVEIDMGTRSRMLYDGGDFNGDGYDDWYASYWDDTIALYYGRSDVAVNGFEKELVHVGPNHQLFLKTSNIRWISLIAQMQDFDFNNDGISDLYFNYFSYDDNLRYDTIGTAIVVGGENITFNDPIRICKSGNIMFGELEYGINSKNIGDINKDGYSDWGTLAQSGCYLELFYGGPEFDFVPDVSFILPQTLRAQCWNWSVGDLNGDTWLDLVIANSSDFTHAVKRGITSEKQDVYVFYGEQNMQSVYFYFDSDEILSDYSTFFQFGDYLSIIGDYNGDGFDDIVTGGNGRFGQKDVFIYFGSDSEIGSEPDLIISGWEHAQYIGWPISACGDINGDGYDDFTLGYQESGGGRSLVFFGGPDADNECDLILKSTDPSSVKFGRYTSKTPGDFDGDGHNDLVQFCYFTDEIYIYRGGPELDTIADYVIADTAFSPSCYSIDFIESSSGANASDLSVCFKINDCYDFHIYSLQNQTTIEEKYLLKNCLSRSGSGIASGDFNGDSITEIFAGIPYEYNYGVPGGIVYFYEPALFSDIDEEPRATAPDETVRLYPNPTTGMLYVESAETITHIELYNFTGQLVFSEKTTSYNHTINLSRLEPGVYFVRISTEIGTIPKQVIIR